MNTSPETTVQHPQRSALRAALAQYASPSTTLALFWVAVDSTAFILASAAAVSASSLVWKSLASVGVGIMIARLFIIGHDACHHALTRHRALNRLVGRLTFLPSLTPFSLWDLGHNQAHHGFTNLNPRDAVWAPLSADDFGALSPRRRRMECLYRSGWAPAVYYVMEIWWKKLIFPRVDQIGSYRSIYGRDSLLVSAFAVAWVTLVAVSAYGSNGSITEALFFACFLPLLFWSWLMGFIIYIHHTDPSIAWFRDVTAWAASQPYLTATLYVECPILDSLLHNILQHPAHHLNMTIPFYRLKAAQKRLQDIVPEYIRTRRLTWSYYWRVAEQCKLYDYDNRRWQPFSAITREHHESA
ncbi:MAG: fatty acid desaturase [Betaproteobacteria bacterium]|nr:fatty acid desaturase [Betaproteobacteria bacterium]